MAPLRVVLQRSFHQKCLKRGSKSCRFLGSGSENMWSAKYCVYTCTYIHTICVSLGEQSFSLKIHVVHKQWNGVINCHNIVRTSALHRDKHTHNIVSCGCIKKQTGCFCALPFKIQCSHVCSSCAIPKVERRTFD